jgi:hypothetical protein
LGVTACQEKIWDSKWIRHNARVRVDVRENKRGKIDKKGWEKKGKINKIEK